MRSNYKFLYLVVFLLSSISLFAQQKTISGTVTDAGGVLLPGVNILVENTNRGTQTDFEGNYSIEVAPGEILKFSFLGFATISKAITEDTKSPINVTMEVGSSDLEEVVITAQGIKRERKALGYAISTVSSEEIERKPQQDIARSLSGKVPGVQITGTGGATGSGTNFIIRSKGSITGNNQPLFIVDGVPFDGGNNAQGSFVDGNSTSSRFLDLDPNNIASVSVLKGLSASVLYGQQGRNGVVLITTKSGSGVDANKKFEISVSNTTYITQISNLPDYTNEYGQGGDQTLNRGFVGNWGNRFDEDLMIEHPYSTSVLAEAFPDFQGVEIPYEAVPDNVSSFFRSGIGVSNSVNISGGGGEQSNLNLNVGHTNEEGYIPENSLRRLNLGLGGATALSNNFRFNGSFNFSHTEVKTPPIAAANGIGSLSIFQRLLFIPRNLDLANLPYQNPIDNSSVYYRTDQENPYWLLYNAGDLQETRRFFGNLGMSYDFNEHISANYRFGLDTYVEELTRFVNKGAVSSDVLARGYLRKTTGTNTIMDHNINLGFNNYELLPELNFNARIGFNARRDEYIQNGTASTDQVVFGVLNERNYVNQSQIDPLLNQFLSFQSYQNIFGLYGQVELDYDSYLYLTLSGRNDWGSTVEPENQSLFYPGASLSFIPTSAIKDFGGDYVNFLKIRGGYGTSAGFPSPFQTRPTLNANPTAFVDEEGNPVPTNGISNIRPNPNLLPELHKEIELGIEGNFFKNRVGLDFTVYKRISEDQILSSALPPATGYTSTTINAGRIDTEGIEASLNLRLIDSENFTWNLNNNFSAYETTVIEIPEDEIVIGGFGNLGNLAIEGEPLGVIKGDYNVRDDEGNLLIDPNDGKVITSSELGLDPKIVGDPNPDWNLTVINTIAYKGLSLSAQVEYQHGGDIYSLGTASIIRRGVVKLVDRERPHVIPGVLADPTTGEPLTDEDGENLPNQIQISANDLYFLNFLDTTEGSIYDASNIRLRDVTLAYELPRNLLNNTPFGSMSFALSGQNIFVEAFNFPDAINYDPEVLSTGVGNTSGLEFGTAPTSKRYSFSIKATF